MFLPWSDVSVGRAFLTWFLDVFLPWSDLSVGQAFLTWFIPWSDISVEDDEDLSEGLFDMGFGFVPPMVICECWACLSNMVLGYVPPMVICKCWMGIFDMVHSMVRYKC